MLSWQYVSELVQAANVNVLLAEPIVYVNASAAGGVKIVFKQFFVIINLKLGELMNVILFSHRPVLSGTHAVINMVISFVSV